MQLKNQSKSGKINKLFFSRSSKGGKTYTHEEGVVVVVETSVVVVVVGSVNKTKHENCNFLSYQFFTRFFVFFFC